MPACQKKRNVVICVADFLFILVKTNGLPVIWYFTIPLINLVIVIVIIVAVM